MNILTKNFFTYLFLLFCLCVFSQQNKTFLAKVKLDDTSFIEFKDSVEFKVFTIHNLYSEYITMFNNIDNSNFRKIGDYLVIENSIKGSTFGARKDIIIWNNEIEWNYYFVPLLRATYSLKGETLNVIDEDNYIKYVFEKGNLIKP